MYCVGLTIFIGAHKVECVEQHRLDALLLQVVYHEVSAHYLALRHYALFLKACEEVLGERAQIVELALHEVFCLAFHVVMGIEFVYVSHVFLLKIIDYLIGTFRVFLVQIVRNLYQCVCCAAHSRQYYECRLTALGYQCGHLAHPFGRTYRCATKLHYLHILDFYGFEILFMCSVSVRYAIVSSSFGSAPAPFSSTIWPSSHL